MIALQAFVPSGSLPQLFWLPGEQSVAQLNARYAAPELAHKQAGAGCDQYSLALIYHDLVVGVHAGGSAHSNSSRTRVDVSKLKDKEKVIVERALHPDPAQRWPSLSEFIHALEEAVGIGAARPQENQEPAFVPVPPSVPAVPAVKTGSSAAAITSRRIVPDPSSWTRVFFVRLGPSRSG